MKMTKGKLALIIREEISRMSEARSEVIPSSIAGSGGPGREVSDIDPDTLSFHDVISDEQGPETDAWELPDEDVDLDGYGFSPDVQHKRPSVEKSPEGKASREREHATKYGLYGMKF